MRRRAFIAGGAGAVTGLTALAGCADPSPNPSATTTPVPVSDDQMAATIAKLPGTVQRPIRSRLCRARRNAVVPVHALRWGTTRAADDRCCVDEGERPSLRPVRSAERDLETRTRRGRHGVSAGLEKRGPDNRRKRIYMSAVTPDLYQGMYQQTIVDFFDGFQPLYVILFGLHGVSWRCGVDRGAGR